MRKLATIHERFIFIYDNVISMSLCEQITALFDKSPDSVPGETGSGVTPVKNNRVLYIDRHQNQWQSIDDTLYNMYGEFAKDYFTSFSWLKITYKDVGYYVKKYAKGEGYYHTHVDVSVNKNSARILGSILYLNTVTQGGETEFTNLDLKIQPIAGRLLLFPPMWMYPHRSVMPKSGDKYTVNTFFVFDA